MGSVRGCKTAPLTLKSEFREEVSRESLLDDQMNAAVAKQIDNYTIEDIYNLPDGQRAELIDGELYMMATPSTMFL